MRLLTVSMHRVALGAVASDSAPPHQLLIGLHDPASRYTPASLDTLEAPEPRTNEAILRNIRSLAHPAFLSADCCPMFSAGNGRGLSWNGLSAGLYSPSWLV